MGRKKKKVKKVKRRNWVAVHAHDRSSAGAHKNRERDVKKGSSRKVKHKKQEEKEA